MTIIIGDSGRLVLLVLVRKRDTNTRHNTRGWSSRREKYEINMKSLLSFSSFPERIRTFSRVIFNFLCLKLSCCSSIKRKSMNGTIECWRQSSCLKSHSFNVHVFSVHSFSCWLSLKSIGEVYEMKINVGWSWVDWTRPSANYKLPCIYVSFERQTTEAAWAKSWCISKCELFLFLQEISSRSRDFHVARCVSNNAK